MESVGLFQHSFGQSLHDHLAGGLGRSVAPGVVAEALKLKPMDIQFFPARGAIAAEYVVDAPSSLDYGVLEMGTNDLCSGKTPLTVAEDIIVLAGKLRDNLSLRHVAVLGIVPRSKKLGCVSDAHVFDLLMRETNKYLDTMLEFEPRLSFVRQQGYYSIPVDAFSKDGVHPNTPLGRRLHCRNLKRAILAAASRAHA